MTFRGFFGAAIGGAVGYFAASFVAADFDITHWSSIGRFLALCASAAAGVIGFALSEKHHS